MQPFTYNNKANSGQKKSKENEEDNGSIYKLNDEYVMLLNEKFGAGAFGKIYKCKNIKTKEVYAGKIESKVSLSPQLAQESKILTAMKGKIGFPTCYKFISNKQDLIMLMDILGPNLDDVMMKMPGQKFSMKTTLMLAQQILQRLKDFHTKGFIHRDMKPDNFVLGGKGKERQIYMIDFGLAHRYINEKTGEHIGFREGKEVIGTVRYVSINTHLGEEQSRRDDLEGLGYIIAYFLLGELPWQGIKARSKKERCDKVGQKKQETVPDELCRFLPEEIKTYFTYVLGLKFTEKPDYDYLNSLFESLMKKYGYSNDLQFDWYNPVSYYFNYL